jgi:hypothetical protein
MILDDGVIALKDLHFNLLFLDDACYCVGTHYAHGRHYLCILVVISGGEF